MMLAAGDTSRHQRRQNVARTALLKMADSSAISNLVAVTGAKPFAGKVAVSPAMRSHRD
jgi:hypothetical protein